MGDDDMIDSLDHLVLTVRDIEATCQFYERVLGMTSITFGENRKALLFGNQKINLHQAGKEWEPKAQHPVPGSADLCLLSSWPMEKLLQHLTACGVEIVEGPVQRTGAKAPLLSIYLRDPDENLIEIANQLDSFSAGSGEATAIAQLFKDREQGIMGEQRLGFFSVLLPLVTMDDGRLGILFEKRASTMRRQADEICFPGGRKEEDDESNWATARRETSEELGLPMEQIEYIGALDILLGPGSSCVYPFVGYLKQIEGMKPNPDEVGEVFIIPLDTFRSMQPARHRVTMFMEAEKDFPFHLIPGGRRSPWRTGQLEHLFYEIDGRVIWGMTARVLAHFIELIEEYELPHEWGKRVE
ncbi:NUDIX domain-containing protein [Brevibacillus invocatus]